MNRLVSFRPEAETDALETRDWYENRRAGLGAEFRRALDETIERIAENPLGFMRVRGETRRAILDRFPYAVYFRAGSIPREKEHDRVRPSWRDLSGRS